MTKTNQPASGADQPMEEAACRRLMVSLYGEKAESLAALLLRSEDMEFNKRRTFDASQFNAFMTAVNHRANVIQNHQPRHRTEAQVAKPTAIPGVASISTAKSRASLRNHWTAWAVAAAALLLIIIGSSLLYRAHLDSSNVAVAPSSSFDLAGESKPASPPAASTSPQH
jgi:hypothetical protein